MQALLPVYKCSFLPSSPHMCQLTWTKLGLYIQAVVSGDLSIKSRYSTSSVGKRMIQWTKLFQVLGNPLPPYVWLVTLLKRRILLTCSFSVTTKDSCSPYFLLVLSGKPRVFADLLGSYLQFHWSCWLDQPIPKVRSVCSFKSC